MIEQIKPQLNQKSTLKSTQTEEDLNYSSVEKHSVSLTDAEYEFLFNQLLEGVAHGWHSVKIAKFFERLGERGQQKLWIDWLERYQAKILAGSDPNQQQLGARMIRLGELSQSIPSIKQIGITAYHIGKQIVYGRDPNLIWEYDGADLPLVPEETTAEETVEPQSAAPESNTSTTSNASSSSSFAEAANWIQDAIAEFIELAETAGDRSATSETENNNEDNSSAETSELEGEDDSSAETSELNGEDDSSAETSELNGEDDSSPETLELEGKNHSSAETLELNGEDNSSPETSELDVRPEQQSEELSIDRPVERKETENLVEKEPNLVKATKSESSLLTEENVINLSWQQFVELIEKDDHLVEQIATQLNLSDKNPQSIIKAVSSQLNSNESELIDKSTLKLIESWFDLGLKQASAGNLDEAIISWEKALELNPNLGEAWHNRGSALGRLGNYEEALASFEQTLKIDPHNAQAWNERGHVLYQLSQWQGAADSWERAVTIVSNNYQFWYNRGCALEKLQQYQEAIASYEKALEIKPDFQLARSRYISLLANRHPIN
ncbi:MAG: tetratricopeptide repeat protein [Xenococcaceae cyanobacterium MO_188.B32]|nr:tetratricopeptide repeat protein [Xenococcaceae cyanobacterium MO_188.B32]